MKNIVFISIFLLTMIVIFGCNETSNPVKDNESNEIELVGNWVESSIYLTLRTIHINEKDSTIIRDTTIFVASDTAIDTSRITTFTEATLINYENNGSYTDIDSSEYTFENSIITVTQKDGTESEIFTGNVKKDKEMLILTLEDKSDTLVENEGEKVIQKSIYTLTAVLYPYSGEVPPTDWPELK